MLPIVDQEKAIFEHIHMLQDIIKRMASNSSSCKQWCVMLTTAILALAVKNNKVEIELIHIAYLPIFLMYFLDCFYLGLERNFKDKQKEFLWKLREGHLKDGDFFIAGDRPRQNDCDVFASLPNFAKQAWSTLKGTLSFSTSPFYGLLWLMLYLLTH